MYTTYSDDMTFWERLDNFKFEIEMHNRFISWEKEVWQLASQLRPAFPELRTLLKVCSIFCRWWVWLHLHIWSSEVGNWKESESHSLIILEWPLIEHITTKKNFCSWKNWKKLNVKGVQSTRMVVIHGGGITDWDVVVLTVQNRTAYWVHFVPCEWTTGHNFLNEMTQMYQIGLPHSGSNPLLKKYRKKHLSLLWIFSILRLHQYYLYASKS